MTATFKQVIKQVKAQTDGSDAVVEAYLKQLEAGGKYVGVHAFFLNNGAAEPELDLAIPAAPAPTQHVRAQTPSLPAVAVPPHIVEELAKICTKFKKEMSEVEQQWQQNLNDPDMEVMGYETLEEKQEEAYQWIVLEYTQEITMGGQKADWRFTLFHVDTEAGSYKKYIQKPGQSDPKNQIQIDVGIASGFGLFTREDSNGETITVADFIGAFATKTADVLAKMKPFITYEAEIEKGKQGFSLNEPVPDIKPVAREEPEQFTKMIAKFAKDMSIQPTALDKIGWKKSTKAKNVVLDCRILQASSFVNDEGQERALLKVSPSEVDPSGEPKAYHITFWREASAEAFKFEQRSRVLVGVRAKFHEEYDYSMTGSFVMPLRVIKKDNPPMTTYTPPPE